MTEDTHTPENKNTVPPQEATDEIDLTEILRKLWLKRKLILSVTGVFLLLGLFVALFSPVKYTASCTVVPQSGKDGSDSNLGGLAAMMGVNIGVAASAGETLSTSVYPQIVKSLPFTREIMQTPIRVEKSGETEISLYDYYTDKQYRPFNPMEGIKKYTIGLPGVFIGTIRGSDMPETGFPEDSSAVLRLNGEEEQVYKTIQSSMQLDLNQKDGYITISYSFPEAEAAARITEQFRKTLEKYVTTFKTEKVKDNLAFVEQSYQAARSDFQEKQDKLAAFQDANRGLTTAIARTTEQRLRSEYDIAFTVYDELAKQLEQAKLAVKETKPILTVIDPVVVPMQKSAPRRGIILIGFLFLGLVVGIGWVFTAPVLKEVREQVGRKQ
jgi:Uncharacterized protein involved in exopolysaccharide biosynthesis